MIVKNFEKKENSTVTFDVVIDAEAFEKAVNKVYLYSRRRIFVPGFRKGKASRTIIEGMYGKDVFYDDAAHDLTPEAYNFGVEQEKLRVVGSPAVVDISITNDKELTLSFLVSVWPEVVLGQYKGLEAPKAKVEITDAQVEEQVERVRQRNSRIITVARPAQEGDTAVIDFEGSIDGEPFEGGSGEGHNLVLGSHSFIPGFEEQVIGMSAGEEREIAVTFPEDYLEKTLAGKPAQFRVKCNEVKENQMPDLDDEFAKDVSEFDTLDEYKASIREKLTSAAEAEAENAYHSLLLEQAGDNMTADIPNAMVEEQLNKLVNDYDQNLQMNGLNLELYLKYTGQDKNSFRNKIRPNAVRWSKTAVVLDKIAQEEGLQASDEEIEAEYKKLADEYQMELEDVKEDTEREVLEDEIKARKAAQIIFDTGIPTEPVAEEPAAAESETESAPEESGEGKAE